MGLCRETTVQMLEQILLVTQNKKMGELGICWKEGFQGPGSENLFALHLKKALSLGWQVPTSLCVCEGLDHI